jgi:hypothetical protein
MWLSAMATALGCLLAFAAVRYLQSVNAVEMPVGAVIAIRWPVLVFAALLCTATTLITGLVPAWRVSKVDLNAGLKAAGRGLADSGLARRSSQILIVAEMTASVVLLWGGGLLLQSVLRLEDANLGFDAPLPLRRRSGTVASLGAVGAAHRLTHAPGGCRAGFAAGAVWRRKSDRGNRRPRPAGR